MFVGYDSWEASLYEPYANIQSEIPCDDVEAYRLLPDYRHLFYKPLICDYFGVYNVPIGARCVRYPVIQKPTINPYGMGMGVREVLSAEDELYVPGTFYMERLEGEHKSIDIMIHNGLPVFHQSAVGKTAIGQTFDYWELIEDELDFDIIVFIIENLTGYSGMLNVETIGNVPIELTFRHAGQFVDMYSSDFLNQLVNIYTNNDVNVSKLEQVTGRYSVPIFVPFIDESRCNDINIPFVKTVDTVDYNPSGGKRLGYINTTDLEGALKDREEILKCYSRS